MNFFNTKDLSELTTNMMADCSSMESLLSSTIPPLIANGITVTLTCILLAFFDWRLALCVFITVPIAFLIIWLSRNHQKKLFEKQVDAKLAASDQVQEYLEGMKIIKSCGLSGSHFSALDKALLAMKKNRHQSGDGCRCVYVQRQHDFAGRYWHYNLCRCYPPDQWTN